MEKDTDIKIKLSKNIEIFLGTYEGKVICIRLDPKSKKTNSISFKSSENCLKVIKLQKKFLFASGNDEIMHIFDIKKLEEKGEVMSYSGTNSHLEINHNFMLLGGSEKTISIWRMSDFNQIHILKGHQQCITAMKLHSSGKILLSSSQDKSFIIWNMLTGIKIFKHIFESICQEIVCLDSKKYENLFILSFEKEFILIDITKFDDGFNDMILKRIQMESKIIQILTFKLNLYVFTNDMKLTIFKNFIDNESHEKFSLDIEKPTYDQVRVKFVNFIRSKKVNVAILVFSNNELYIYDLNKINKNLNTSKTIIKKFHEIKLNNERVTCIAGKFTLNKLLA